MGCAGAGAVASPRRERRVQDTPLSPEPARIAPETLRSVGSASSSLCAFVEEENDEANINGLGLQRFVHNRQGLLESSSAGMSPAIRSSQLWWHYAALCALFRDVGNQRHHCQEYLLGLRASTTMGGSPVSAYVCWLFGLNGAGVRKIVARSQKPRRARGTFEVTPRDWVQPVPGSGTWTHVGIHAAARGLLKHW